MITKISNKKSRRLFSLLATAAFMATSAEAGNHNLGNFSRGAVQSSNSNTSNHNFTQQFSNNTATAKGSQYLNSSSLNLSSKLQNSVISANVGQSSLGTNSTNLLKQTGRITNQVTTQNTSNNLLKQNVLQTKNTGIVGNVTNNQLNKLVNQATSHNQLNLNALNKSNMVSKLNLDTQILHAQKGDITRSLNLGKQLMDKGGWANRLCGPISSNYTQCCKSHCYCGPCWCPNSCWFPTWCPWVNWCWYYYPIDYCDPRPLCCRPIVYYPCTPCCVDDCPTYQPLYSCSCGTWVDVPAVAATGCDVQLLAVRFVDGGHPDQQLGPRFRVWVRNNSSVAIDKPFNVSLFAATEEAITTATPQGGVRVTKLGGNETQAVDVRLPFSVTQGTDGQSSQFNSLKVIVDSKSELNDTDRSNNGTSVARDQILPIDPALFAAEDKNVTAGSMINLSGEGLGPEAGQLILTINNQPHQAEIQGWFDLGVQVKLPSLALTSPTPAQLVVIRGDGTASNPVDVVLNPAATPDASQEQVSMVEM